MRFALIEAKLGIAKALRLVEIQKCEKTEVSNYDIIVIVLSAFQSEGTTSIRQNGIFVRQKWYMDTCCPAMLINHVYCAVVCFTGAPRFSYYFFSFKVFGFAFQSRTKIV
jgi:hypothetical protein